MGLADIVESKKVEKKEDEKESAINKAIYYDKIGFKEV